MPIIHPENPGPLRPGVPRGASLRRLGKKLQVDQGLAAVAERGANAVGARVASANNDDGLVLGADVVAVLEKKRVVGNMSSILLDWMKREDRMQRKKG